VQDYFGCAMAEGLQRNRAALRSGEPGIQKHPPTARLDPGFAPAGKFTRPA
jgi:hypothetical protein